MSSRRRIVVALGGNALMRPGRADAASQEEAIGRAAHVLAPVAAAHDLVITHGNGPQIGALTAQGGPGGLDDFGAATEGMLGYLLERELRSAGVERVATLVTLAEVAPDDPAFTRPDKPIGTPDVHGRRRLVASPDPLRILESEAIAVLVDASFVVICSGGGGVPVVRDGARLAGASAVVDKDLSSARLAESLRADLLVLATDVDGAYLDWGRPTARRIDRIHPQDLVPEGFPTGSMRPKVRAAREFALSTGRDAVIGSLDDLSSLVRGRCGTVVSTRFVP